jgi:serine/threonine protein kinase
MSLPTKYIIEKKLGEGQFGDVYLAEQIRINRKEAVKIIKTSKIDEALQEAKTLQELKHEHIVDIYDADVLPDGSGIFISMEYYPKGSFAKIKFLPRRKILDIAIHSLRALEFAHLREYIHRDIKPSNILQNKQGKALLSDFGLSSKIDDIGSGPQYKYSLNEAPETIKKMEQDNPRTDIYELGVTLNRLINGDPRWLDTIEEHTLKNKIIKGEYPDRNSYRPDISDSLIKLINKAMSPDHENKRFQTAKKMRIDLEKKVTVPYDWHYKKSCWILRTEDIETKIEILRSGKLIDIITSKKRIESLKFRRMNKYCFNSKPINEVNYIIHNIISDIDRDLT